MTRPYVSYTHGVEGNENYFYEMREMNDEEYNQYLIDVANAEAELAAEAAAKAEADAAAEAKRAAKAQALAALGLSQEVINLLAD